jgi:hypothetical protein
MSYLYKLYMNTIKIGKRCSGFCIEAKLLLKIATIVYSLH